MICPRRSMSTLSACDRNRRSTAAPLHHALLIRFFMRPILSRFGDLRLGGWKSESTSLAARRIHAARRALTRTSYDGSLQSEDLALRSPVSIEGPAGSCCERRECLGLYQLQSIDCPRLFWLWLSSVDVPLYVAVAAIRPVEPLGRERHLTRASAAIDGNSPAPPPALGSSTAQVMQRDEGDEPPHGPPRSRWSMRRSQSSV